MDPHGFEAGDQVTLAGLAFTCLGSTGITTTIFPDPQQSYTVDSITGSVGTSKTFTTFVGGSLGYVHIFNPAIHYFVRSKAESITDNNNNKYTPTAAEYSGKTGNLILTLGSHGLTTSDTVSIATSSLVFTCTQDNNSTEHAYPRPTDPVAGIQTAITAVTGTTITVYVGVSTAGGLVAPLQMEFLASILENTTA
jgi:hypothetical protein